MKIEELVNKHLQMPNPTNLIVWRYIYAHKKECCYMSIYDMAEACNVSRTTILRFAKKLSLDGFSDLKALLKQEAGRHIEPAPEADIVQATVDLCRAKHRKYLHNARPLPSLHRRGRSAL